MSARSIKRGAEQRRDAATRRRARRARRATVAAGAAIGASLLTAAGADAANIVVDSLTDGPADACAAGSCTLRDAIKVANENGEADVITFATGPGTITLTNGPLAITEDNPLFVQGPGADELTISGDSNENDTHDSGDTRIFGVQKAAPTAFSGLTLTEGFSSTGAGAAVYSNVQGPTITIAGSSLTDNVASPGGGAIDLTTGGKLTVADSVLADNASTISGSASDGGAIRLGDGADLKISDSEITGNDAGAAKGGAISVQGVKYTGPPPNPGDTAVVSITDSVLSDNNGGTGGAIALSNGDLTLKDSQLTGNTTDPMAAVAKGGAIYATNFSSLDVDGSELTANSSAKEGGAIFFDGLGTSKYGLIEPANTITDTTIADNQAPIGGGGISVYELDPGAAAGSGRSFRIERSTLSGNSSDPGTPASPGSGVGGGLAVSGTSDGELAIVDSTISGNSAAVGGGAMLGTPGTPLAGLDGSVSFANSTVAENSATHAGGGLYLTSYGSSPSVTAPAVPLPSAIIADNQGPAGPQDLASEAADTGQGFELDHTLVEAPDTARRSEAGPAIVGQDPQLGSLGDNGGPTPTMLPAASSPALDAGSNPLSLAVDQRLRPRERSGVDIGAVEVQIPETTITSGPSGKIGEPSATFAFSSDLPGATFECRLDDGPWQACTSPRTLKGLDNGDHTFAVRAKGDVVDPAPATRSFTVAVKPVVTITKAPKKVKTKRPKAKVKVAFKSSAKGSSFECKVDKGKFKRCKSPLKAKLASKPGRGKRHTIKVRATKAGVTGKAAKVKVKVVRKR